MAVSEAKPDPIVASIAVQPRVRLAAEVSSGPGTPRLSEKVMVGPIVSGVKLIRVAVDIPPALKAVTTRSRPSEVTGYIVVVAVPSGAAGTTEGASPKKPTVKREMLVWASLEARERMMPPTVSGR